MSRINSKLRHLGFSEKRIEHILGNLSLDQIQDLYKACENNDKDAIMKTLLVDENEEELSKADDSETTTEAPLSIDDTVKWKGQDVLVKNPNGPRGTIGISIDGNTKYVEKTDKNLSLSEAVVIDAEFEDAPPMARMMRLAGMKITPSCEATPKVDHFNELLSELEDGLKDLTIQQFNVFKDRLRSLYLGEGKSDAITAIQDMISDRTPRPLAEETFFSLLKKKIIVESNNSFYLMEDALAPRHEAEDHLRGKYQVMPTGNYKQHQAHRHAMRMKSQGFTQPGRDISCDDDESDDSED